MSATVENTITIDALASYSGDDAPEFLLLVDGQQIGSGVISAYNSETVSFSADLVAGEPHTVSIDFTNYNTSGQMLNVDAVSINGQTISSGSSAEDYTSSHGTLYSSGQMYYGGQVNFSVPAADFPPSSGTGSNSGSGSTGAPPTPPIPPAAVTIGSGPDTLALSVAEDAYLGDAQFTISVDGVQQGGVQTATASNAAGQTQAFDVEGSFGAGPHTVAVNFLNDAYGGSASTDRNLYVTGASIDGQSVAGAALNEYTDGAQSFAFTGAAPVPPAAVTIGSGPDTLALSVAEDAYLGDAQFTISVDGVQQGGVQTATASNAAGQTQAFDVEGSFGAGPHTVAVNFLNDAYGGSASTDRNLYVTGASIDGQSVAGAALNEYTDGAQSFAFAGAASTPTAPANPTPGTPTTPTSPAFYVSVTGSDSGDGSAAHPFATMQYAIGQMEADSVQTLYVGSGTYSVGLAVTLTAADSGDSILAAPGAAPVLTAAGDNSTLLSLDGAQDVTISGLAFANAGPSSQGSALLLSGSSGDAISGNVFAGNSEAALFAAGSSHDTFNDNQIDNSATSAVEIKDGSDFNTFSNNVVNGVGATNVSGAAFYGHGISNDVFANNLVENTAGAGIAIEDYGLGNTVNSSNTITGNQLINTSDSLASTDDGAIYLLGRSDNNLQTTVSMNFISNVGNVNPNAHAEGIYLDDNSSGVSVSSNIVQGVQSDAIELHGGYDVSFTNNILNLGSETRTAALIQQPEANQPATVQAPLTNDTFQGNIITSQQADPQYAYVYFDPEPVNVNIAGNLYWDPEIPAGGLADTYGIYFNPNTPAGGLPLVPPVSDSSPAVGNPNFVTTAAGSYGIGPGSAASLIHFTAIDQALIGPQPG